MSAPITSVVVREVINGNLDLPADDIVRMVQERGVTASDSSIRGAIYNVKSELRKASKKPQKKAAPKPAPAAARDTSKPAQAKATAPKTAVAAATPSSPPDLRAMLANVALVNGVLGACGGAEGARKLVEVVQACGGVEPFLLHLDLVAGIRGASA